MRNSILCKIEHLHATEEEAVIISFGNKELAETYTLLSAFYSNKLDKVVFNDSNNAHTVLLVHSSNSSKKEVPLMQIDEESHLLNNKWFEAVYNLLIDVFLNGWHQGAHVDFAFAEGKKEFQLCIAVNPPHED